MGTLLSDPVIREIAEKALDREISKPTTLRVTPESVFALLRRRKARGVDPNLDHAELFERGGIILRGPTTQPALLMYSIDKTAFFVRAASRPDVDAFLLTEESMQVPESDQPIVRE